MSMKSDINTLLTGTRRIARRDGVVGDLVLFAPTTVPIFTVVGGDILVHALYAKVITVAGLDVAATTITLSLTTAIGGTVVPIAGAGVNVSAATVEALITITGAVAVAPTLFDAAARGVGIPNITNIQIYVPGSIGMIVGGATNAGLLDWTIIYTPLHATSLVVVV